MLYVFRKLKRFFSSVILFAHLFSTVAPLYSTIYAQEATPAVSASIAPVATDEPSPTAEATTSPAPTTAPETTIEPSASLTPTVTSTPEPTTAPSADPSPEVTASPSATPVSTPDASNKELKELSPDEKNITPDDLSDFEASAAASFATTSATFKEKIFALGEKPVFQDYSESKVVKQKYVEGEVIVKFKKDKLNLHVDEHRNKASEFAHRYGLQKKSEILVQNLAVMKSEKEESVPALIDKLKQEYDVEYVQPNYIYEPHAISTNDTYRAELWGLDNTGQTVNGVPGTVDADIDAPEAWAMSEGSGVTVAVIDTGVNYTHPDLTNSMWDGTNCKNESNVTIGGCNHGYDYEHSDASPLPTSSDHGTHVAGTIAAVKNNNRGIVGVASSAKIMALKTQLTDSEIINSINFARFNGAKVINASWGGGGYSSSLKAAIDSFPGLFINSAGNDYNNNDTNAVYPCNYTSSNIICVGATNSLDEKADFSNYGATTVDVFAPGVDIFSTRGSVTTSSVYSENFESVENYAIPANYEKSLNSYWGVYDLLSTIDNEGKYLFADNENIPVLNNQSTAYTSPTYNMSGATAATIELDVLCDTEYTYRGDYLALEVSSDGFAFTEIAWWDERTIDDLFGNTNQASYAGVANYPVSVNPAYLTANFKYRFRWVTNSATAGDLGWGCFVDNIDVTKTTASLSEAYGFLDGTSMAAPHVAGMAAVIHAYDTNLTAAQTKEIILNTGDQISGLSGVSVTGRRVNLLSALYYIRNRSLDTTYYYPWYDDGDPAGKIQEAFILVANPSTSQTANIEIYFQGALRFSGTISPGQSINQQFDEEVGGPVRVVSTNSVPIYSSLRVRYADSFNETLGVPASELSSTYFYPWYDDTDTGGFTREAWVIIANPSTSQNVTVETYYKGVMRYEDTIGPGGVILRQFDEEVGGPVRVVEKNGRDFYTSEKVVFQDSINEIMGYPENQLSNTYYYPWYDDSDNGGFTREAWVLVGNPSSNQTANVQIYYKGILRFTGTVSPGESIFPQFNEEYGGPVKVVSDIPVYTTERVRFQNSFNETFGLPEEKLTNIHYFPWYDDSNNGGYVREAWVLVANPSTSQTAEIEIFYKGQKRTRYSISPGQSYTPQYDEEYGGPVKVVSTNGVTVYSTERVRFQDSFNEIFAR